MNCGGSDGSDRFHFHRTLLVESVKTVEKVKINTKTGDSARKVPLDMISVYVYKQYVMVKYNFKSSYSNLKLK